jgi:hypothetical protein
MKTRQIYLVGLTVLLLALLAIPVLASQQVTPAADTYDLTWFTHDNGVEPVSSADGFYSLSGTAGQPDAEILADGYTLSGGFWYGAIGTYRISLPVVVK